MAKIIEKGLIAKKVGMTRMVDANGNMIPVTLLQVEEQKITKVLTPERDGYHGVQVGFLAKGEKHLSKADLQRLRKSGVEENYSRFIEFRTDGPVEHFELGKSLTAELFDGIDKVDITGVTKGRGFQGAVRRWNSRIGRMTHGSRFHRRPGSLGQCTTPGRVYKNKKMPGHMGSANRTIKNLKVVDIDVESKVIAIKGSVPGNRHGYLEIRPTNKK
ncbi:MAG: 50S ribosomal protein L3 [Bdellovibrionota bacterium]